MTLLRSIIQELVSLFIDDGALATLTALLIGASLALRVYDLARPEIIALVLLAGYVLLLAESVLRFAANKDAVGKR